MSDTKWTPGPWAVHPFRAYVVPAEHLNRPIGCDTDDARDLREYAQEICLIHWPDRHRPESEVKANANVMAAAPELYSELAKVEWAQNDNGFQCCPRCGSGRPNHYEGCGLAAALAKARGEA